MKKRLLCLFLGLIMVLSVALTACSSKDEKEADVDEDIGAQTITMSVLTTKKVCNTDEELAAYLADVCGGDEESKEYKDMLAVKAAYDAVEAEFTKITKSKYKVNVDLLFFTEDEYEEKSKATIEKYAEEQKSAQRAERALNKYISDYQAAYPEANYPKARLAEEFYRYFPEFEKYKGYSSDDEDEEANAFEEQYKENELGIKELVYPETEENQQDIIFISGLDMFNEYVDNEWLASLDDHINTTGRKLNDYIPSALLNGVKADGSTYAVPNNIQIGEYTYMLIDKALMDKYYYDHEAITNLLDCNYFLEDIMNSEPEVLPIDASFEECMKLFVWYWNIDREKDDLGDYVYSINTENKFSMIGAVYGDPATAGRGKVQLGFQSLFANEEYREIFLRLMEYKYNGHYVEENDTRKNAAISFVTGDYTIKDSMLNNNGVYTDENGKEYYAYVAKYPEADETSLYGNMFGVSATSKHLQASVQVITLLNTNSELRNILQYGIENINYVIDEETGSLKRLNKLYEMKVEQTGNCFIAHPEEGYPADYWESSKKQNNDALINPLLGFDFNRELAELDAQLDNTLLGNVEELARQTLVKIEDCVTYEELDELVNNPSTGLRESMKADVPMYIEGYKDPITVRLTKITNQAYDTATGNGGDADTNGESPYTIYYNWMTTYGFLPK